MPGHINDTTRIRRTGRLASAACLCVAVVTGICCSQAALAKPGGEPLVLDTQTGIHSGTSGTVLQSAPLGGPGMVPMATLPGPPQQAEPPIIVSPYVEYSNAQASAPSAPPRGNGRPRVQPHPYP